MMDSGAGNSVASPGHFPEYRMEESEGSRQERMYQLADNHEIPNLGEKHIGLWTGEGQPCLVTMQMCDVGTPSWSVKELVAKGNTVVFQKKGGYIANPTTGFKTFFKERGGVYYIQMAVEDPKEAARWGQGQSPEEARRPSMDEGGGAQDFGRQG